MIQVWELSRLLFLYIQIEDYFFISLLLFFVQCYTIYKYLDFYINDIVCLYFKLVLYLLNDLIFEKKKLHLKT